MGNAATLGCESVILIARDPLTTPDKSSPQPTGSPAGTPNGTPADVPPSPYRVSDRHAAVRLANRTETAEDYVEAIADFQAETGNARVRDLAACFGVSHVTVSRTVDRLQRDGLVTTAPYRAIELTDAGRAMARASKERHAAVLHFLLVVGVPKETAEIDAEGIEHHVGAETLAAFQRFIDRTPTDTERPAPPSTTGASPPDNAPETSTAADRFERVRAAHATELTEDYVEAIGDLISDKGEARVTQLARHFGVSHVTVSRTLGRLQRDGFVKTAPYRPVHLTSKGSALATRSKDRHRIVLAFLGWLGVPARQSEIDAEGVEHHVSLATLRLFAIHCGCPPPKG